MKAALVAVAALTLAAAPVQASTGDQAQLVLISGTNAERRKGGTDVISKVTFTMPTMYGCNEAGEEWIAVEDVGFRMGWRKYQCFERF